MAHDLRNYLTPLKGRLEQMERRACRAGREQDVHNAAATTNTLNLLERVISDLLDVARLNQSIFTIHPQPSIWWTWCRKWFLLLADQELRFMFTLPRKEVVQVTLALPMEDENLSECDQEGSCPIR